jgi:hypothetical protein
MLKPGDSVIHKSDGRAGIVISRPQFGVVTVAVNAVPQTWSVWNCNSPVDDKAKEFIDDACCRR